jgi:hypothetical protein
MRAAALWILSAVLTVLWLLGWAYDFGGRLIHLLLVLALIALITHLLTFPDGKRKILPRAERIPVATQIDFRKIGSAEWHCGTTVNISRTGVLFQAEELVPVNTPVEMKLEIPPQVVGQESGNVISKGYIVRAVLPGPGEGVPALAATIWESKRIEGFS